MLDHTPSQDARPRILAEVPAVEYRELTVPDRQENTGWHRSIISLLRGNRGGGSIAQTKTQPLPQQTFEFNVAAWIRVAHCEKQIFSLLLCYEDVEGEHSVLVDEAEISSNYALMLAGQVKIVSKGPIVRLRVGCLGLLPSQQPILDELHVQRIRKAKASVVRPRSA